MKIPFSPPDITEEEIQSVADALRSGWITTGPKTKELEKELAGYCNVNKAACLSSATACMELALRLFEIGPGDEVIVPAYTYTATASVVCHVGAKLVLIDSGKDSFHLDYDALENAITDKTKAVIPVDIAGVMPDYDRIFEIIEAKKNIFSPASKYQEALGRILVLADSAHGLGASYKGRMSGSVADFTSFSFHAVKNFTTAEGGCLTWKSIPGIDDEEIYKKIQLFSLHGQSKDALAKTMLGAWEYDIVDTFYKCNMTDIAAAIGLVQLKRYEGMLKRRHQLIDRYIEGIKADDISYLEHYTDVYTSSGHLMLVRLKGATLEERNDLIIELAKQGISTNVHYKPLPMHTAYKKLGFDIKDYQNAWEMFHNEITLPLHTKLTDIEQEYVIDKFNTLRHK